MNKPIILNVNTMDDLKRISKNTKYINLNINKIDVEVIDYFLVNGKDYSYSEVVNDKNGFIYVSYDILVKGENIITSIIDNMSLSLNVIEKIRYLYISLGKILCEDINMQEDKNDNISFSNISSINNIWASLSYGKTTNVTISKLFMYLCNRCNIKSELVMNSIKENMANKVFIDDNFIIVSLFDDIKYIQGNLMTHYFDRYNNDKEIDKKIGYIKDDYNDYYIDRELKTLDYNDSGFIYNVLNKMAKVFNINMIGTSELSSLCMDIFDKYCPNYNIKLNNFYVFDNIKNKEHFIVIEYEDEYYSFNYNKNCFINLKYDIIVSNLLNNRIGLYSGEEFLVDKREVLL